MDEWATSLPSSYGDVNLVMGIDRAMYPGKISDEYTITPDGLYCAVNHGTTLVNVKHVTGFIPQLKNLVTPTQLMALARRPTVDNKFYGYSEGLGIPIEPSMEEIPFEGYLPYFQCARELCDHQNGNEQHRKFTSIQSARRHHRESCSGRMGPKHRCDGDSDDPEKRCPEKCPIYVPDMGPYEPTRGFKCYQLKGRAPNKIWDIKEGWRFRKFGDVRDEFLDLMKTDLEEAEEKEVELVKSLVGKMTAQAANAKLAIAEAVRVGELLTTREQDVGQKEKEIESTTQELMNKATDIESREKQMQVKEVEHQQEILTVKTEFEKCVELCRETEVKHDKALKLVDLYYSVLKQCHDCSTKLPVELVRSPPQVVQNSTHCRYLDHSNDLDGELLQHQQTIETILREGTDEQHF